MSKIISPRDYVLLINAPGVPGATPHTVSGLSEADDAIMFERDADAIQTTVGVQGDAAVCISADRSGTITLKLQQTSPTNKVLNGIHSLQQGGGRTAVPFQLGFQDLRRLDAVESAVCFIKKLPQIQRGGKVAEQVWAIWTQNMPVVLGDPIFTGVTALAEAL